MEVDLSGLSANLAALRPTVKKSKLDELLGEHWPTIEASLKMNISKRQIHQVLVGKHRLDVSYSHFSLWCKQRLEEAEAASK